MEKMILLSLLFFLLSIELFGQHENRDKVDFGLSWGITLNDVYDHPSGFNFKTRISPIVFGLSLDYKISDRFDLKTELDYVHKGPLDYKIDYLILSVLPQIKFIKIKDLSVMLGPYIGYLFEYRTHGEVSNHEALKGYDFGIESGIEYKKMLGKKVNLFISPRIELGLIEFSFSKHIVYQLKVGIEY
jgi:hypothetical protein